MTRRTLRFDLPGPPAKLTLARVTAVVRAGSANARKMREPEAIVVFVEAGDFATAEKPMVASAGVGGATGAVCAASMLLANAGSEDQRVLILAEATRQLSEHLLRERSCRR